MARRPCVQKLCRRCAPGDPERLVVPAHSRVVLGVPRRGGFSLYLSTPPGLGGLVPAGELTWLGRRCPGRPRAGTPAAGPHSSISVTPVTAGNYRGALSDVF